MIKRQLTREELVEQMKFLSGTSGSNLNESTAPSNKNSTLLYYKQAPDGRTLGIVSEGSKFFIKTTTGKKATPTASDFVYIGGVQNKLEERFDSYNVAKNRLGFKIKQLNEVFGTLEEEIPLNADLDKEKGEEEEVAVENTPTETAPVEEPVVDTPVETTDTVNEPVVTDAPAEVAPEGETASTPTPTGGEKNTADEVQSLIGKLSQKFSELGDVDEKIAKNAINSIISSTKTGIEKMDDSEKDRIKQRIDRNGEKIEESFNALFDKMVLKEELKKKGLIKESDDDYQGSEEEHERKKLKDLYKKDELSDDEDDSDTDGDFVVLSQFDTEDKPEIIHTAKNKQDAEAFATEYKQDLGKKRERFKVWSEKKVGKLQELDSDDQFVVVATNGGETEELDSTNDETEAKRLVDEYTMAFGKDWKVSYKDKKIDESGTSAWGHLMEELCGVHENSKKLAINYLNELHQDNSDVLSEMHNLSEDDMYGKLDEIDLKGAFNKVKSFFTGKQVEDILAKQPEIAKDVATAKEILASGDMDQWAKFKVNARKNLVIVMMVLKLMGIGSSAFAQDYKQIVPDNIKSKIEMVDTKGGDKTPTSGIVGDTKQVADSTLSKLMLPSDVKSSDGGKTYTYLKIIPGDSRFVNIQFSARGGDKTGPSIDVNNKKVEADSKEVEKKFEFIKNEIQKLGEITPEQFKSDFAGVKTAFESRFTDSELDLKGDEIVFTHKFLDNDNIAQSDYKTVDGQKITKGDKIPQGTKVVDLLGAKIDISKDGTDTKKEQAQATAVTNKKTTIDKTKLSSRIQDRDKIANDLIKKLKDAGFDVETDGNYIVVNEKGFFVDQTQAKETLNTLNKWASDNLKIDNMFSFGGQELARSGK